MAETRKKRERSANYTEEEKTMLADIVMSYKHIIEDKRTGGTYLSKKIEAWKAISRKYNSNASTGYRGSEQLKTLYDNLKQKARKKVGECNKIEYINREPPLKDLHVVTDEDLANALQNVKEDKTQMNKTGGGVYKPKTTDSDAKILAIIQDQVNPLPNPFDSGAVYFKDDDDINITPFNYHVDFFAPSPPSVHSVQSSIPEEQYQKETSETGPDKRKQNEKKKPKAKKNIMELKRNKSAEALKKLYFKKKCQNAVLERKKLMQEMLYMKQEHVLKMKILNKQLS